MNCPRCSAPLQPRTSQGITAHVCAAHGAWQDWSAINELIKRSRAAEDRAEVALLQGFLWGQML